MKKEISVFLENEKNTSELGLKLSEKLTAGLLLFLKGDLGAGKTCLVRSILVSLGFEGKVKSPSYSLFEQYIIDGKTINHFDLYRFKSPEEWLAAGFNDYINKHDITIIEWPEKAQNILCEPDIEIEILYDKEISRRALVNAKSKKGEMVCKDLV
jgi:tRNA threonylcarbamoyladenosine biosynthesis protein TsaE